MVERSHRPHGLVRLTALVGLAGWSALVGLAGCGGGVYIGYGGDEYDRAPTVSLAASPGSAAPGQSVTLVAAASDDHRVDRVEFFRVDAAGNAFALGTDGAAPYQFVTAVPNDGTGSVRYFARAVDDVNQYNDSPSVTVTVLR